MQAPEGQGYKTIQVTDIQQSPHNTQLYKLEGTASYTGLLLAPAEGFGRGKDFFALKSEITQKVFKKYKKKKLLF